MKESKATQGEGFDFYDYDVLVFPPSVAPVEAIYVVGTNQNAVIQGAWPNEAGWNGSLITVNAAAAQPNVVVADTTNFAVGQLVLIIDPVTNLSEAAVIVLITPAVAPAGVLTMAAVLANPYLVANASIVQPYLPVDAQNTLFFASVDVNIRLVNRALTAQLALEVLPGGVAAVPGQIVIPATTWFTLPDKWYVIHAIAVGLLPGTLIIKASG